jgi:hypothetical protein
VGNEDILHLFFPCPSSINVWSMLLFFSSISILLQQEWIARILSSKHYKIYLRTVRLYFVVCCGVSNKVWNEVIDAQVYVVERAKVMPHDWQDARRICNTSCGQPRQKGNVKWIKPAEGRFKCNIDASFSQLSKRVE